MGPENYSMIRFVGKVSFSAKLDNWYAGMFVSACNSEPRKTVIIKICPKLLVLYGTHFCISSFSQ